MSKKWLIVGCVAASFLLSSNVFAVGESSCKELMPRIRAGEKIPSQKWWDCLDQGTKEQIVIQNIKMIKERQGVLINGSASYYVNEIDAIRTENEVLRSKAPIITLLKSMAIMSFDFDEGISKEETLRKNFTKEQADKFIELRNAEGTTDGMLPQSIRYDSEGAKKRREVLLDPLLNELAALA